MLYVKIWRNKFLAMQARSIDEFIAALENGVADLRAMRDAGVTLEGGADQDYARFVTKDPEIAKRFGMETERES